MNTLWEANTLTFLHEDLDSSVQRTSNDPQDSGFRGKYREGPTKQLEHTRRILDRLDYIAQLVLVKLVEPTLDAQ